MSGCGWLPQQVIAGTRKTVEDICTAYGLTAGPRASMTPVSRGAVGRIWRLDLGAERFAVKELFWEADEEPIRREAAVTAQLAAAGIRLPGSVPDRRGRFLARLAGEAGGGRVRPADDGQVGPAGGQVGPAGGGWVRLYRWIDGSSVDLDDPGVAGRVGDLLGRLHAQALPPDGEADPWYQTVPGPAAWDQLAGAGLARGAHWAPALAERVDLLRELTDLVTPAAADQLITCHRDLHPDNVLVDSAGELVLLDWDDTGPACPGRELAKLLADWHVHDGTADAAAVRRTLAAYRAAGGPGRLGDERSFGMLVACMLNFLHGQAGLALDPGAAPEHREYACAEISDTLARLPAPALIARLMNLAAAVLR